MIKYVSYSVLSIFFRGKQRNILPSELGQKPAEKPGRLPLRPKRTSARESPHPNENTASGLAKPTTFTRKDRYEKGLKPREGRYTLQTCTRPHRPKRKQCELRARQSLRTKI